MTRKDPRKKFTRPRDMAAAQIEAMEGAAALVWETYKHELEVTDINAARRMCWDHIRTHFSKAGG